MAIRVDAVTWSPVNVTSQQNNEVTTGAPNQACFLTDSNDDSAVQLSYNIYLVSTIALVVTGLIGNNLSVRVFTSKSMRSFSSNVYLLVLAISDSFYLISIFLTKILTTLRCQHFPKAQFDVANRSAVWCKMLQYMLDLFSDYSTCLILAFTVERCIAAYIPTKFKRLCTVQRARVTCVGLFLGISIFIAPYHMMWVHRYPAPHEACVVMLEHEEAFTALYLTETFLFRIVPVITIAILNVFIIVRVWRIIRHRKLIAASETRQRQTSCVGSRQGTPLEVMSRSHNKMADKHRRLKMLKDSRDDGQAANAACSEEKRQNGNKQQEDNMETDSLESSPASDNNITTHNRKNIADNAGKDGGTEAEIIKSGTSTKGNDGLKVGGRRDDKSLQMTIMLIIVSTSYVLAYMPTFVLFIIWKLERLKIMSLSDRAVLIAQNYTRPLYVAGFAINFFLYTVSGPVFRRQLLRIIGCKSSVRYNDTAVVTAAGAGGCGRCNQQRPSRV